IRDQAHRSPRGCIFDWFTGDEQLQRTMMAATICGEHLDKLKKRGVGDDALGAIRKLLEAVRRYVIGEVRPVPAAVFIGHGHSPAWRQVQDWVEREVRLPVQEFNLEGAAGIATTER